LVKRTCSLHSFGEEQSSFEYLHSRKAKERKDVINRMFSAQAIEQMRWLVRDKVCSPTYTLTSSSPPWLI